MIAIDQGTPVEPGIYLFKGKFGSDVEIINVWQKETEWHGGVEFRGFLAAYGGHNVAKYLGKWSKRLKITDKGLEEA